MHLYEVVVHLVAATDMLGLQLGAYNTFRWHHPDTLFRQKYLINTLFLDSYQ